MSKTLADVQQELSNIEQQKIYLGRKRNRDWLNKEELKRIGFTDGAIQDFLGEPDEYITIRSSYYGKVVNCAYHKERVANKMGSTKFINWFEKRKQRKGVNIDIDFINQIFPELVVALFEKNELTDLCRTEQEKLHHLEQQEKELLALKKQLQKEAQIKKAEIESHLDLNNYEKSFYLARGLNRQIIGVFGPTNSGKTHQAITALKSAKSGCYLAPLRLLALEVFERLNAEGTPCNLLTGEESIVVEGATHTASTIEMCNFGNPIEVAVIDEVQMLYDNDRGSAWTAAVVGVPANVVYLIGAPESTSAVKKIIHSIGETLEVHTKERLSPLIACDSHVTLGKLQKGDVVVAFSRREVLELAQDISKQGFSVSTIYGALAPEVRRLQVARFVEGTADIVVATDAIGMGLNLPAKRVIFSEVEKYDGVSMRNLSRSECVQIAGRAGRYVEGANEVGYYAGMDSVSHGFLKGRLNSSPTGLSGAVAISPNYSHIEKLQMHLQPPKKSQLHDILQFFAQHTALDSGIFKVGSLFDMIVLARVVDKYDISLHDKFTFACAPVNLRDASYGYYLNWLALFALGKEINLGAVPQRVTNELAYAEDFSKKISLYSWLSNKFPHVFVDVEQVSEARIHVSNCIDSILARQNKAKQSLDRLGKMDMHVYKKTPEGVRYIGVFKGVSEFVRQYFPNQKKAHKKINTACLNFDEGTRKTSFNGWWFYRNPELVPTGVDILK